MYGPLASAPGFHQVALLSLATAAPAFAAPVGAATPAPARAEIAYPAQVRRLQDLNFGYLSVTTAGTAVMNPDTDALTTTGGVVSQGGFPYAALFEAVSPRKGVVIVRIPRNPITLTRVGGTETMTVSTSSVRLAPEASGAEGFAAFCAPVITGSRTAPTPRIDLRRQAPPDGEPGSAVATAAATGLRWMMEFA